MTYPQAHESVRVSRFVSGGGVLVKQSGRTGVSCADPPLPQPAFTERLMDMIPDSAQSPSAQYIDPLIANARLVNLAADLERRLAIRKALRPMRSAAARKGWEVRNGL